MILSAWRDVGRRHSGVLCAITVTAAFVGCASRRVPPGNDVRTPRRAIAVPGWDAIASLREPPSDRLSPREIQSWNAAWDALLRDDLDASYGHAMEVLDKRPALERAQALAGLIEVRAGRLMSARNHFARAWPPEPDGEAGDDSGGRERLAALYYVAAARGITADAWSRLKELHGIAPDHPLVAIEYDPTRLRLATDALVEAREVRHHDVSAALALYRDAIDLVPDAAELRTEYGTLLLANGHPDEAREEAELAARLAPDDVAALGVYAETLRATGEWNEALRVYERARWIEPYDRELTQAYEALARDIRERSVPPEYQSIAEAKAITREQIAAALYFGLRDQLRSTPRAPVIVTDVYDSWARDYITDLLAVGLLTAERNHTFEPERKISVVELQRWIRRAAAIISPACDSTRASGDGGGGDTETRGTKQGTLPPSLFPATERGSRFASGREALELVSRLEEIACQP